MSADNHQLLERIEQWVGQASATGQLASAQQRQLKQALDDARSGRLQQPPPVLLTVLLLGASGGGKSELLNALAGSSIARSHHLRPTTTFPTVYAHSSVQPERLYEYGSALADLAKHPGSFVTHEREELRDKILIDAPDIDSFKTEHRELVMGLLPAVDVVLYVVTPFSYKDDVGWGTVLAERGRRAFAFIMNKWDAEGKPTVPAGAPDVDEDFLRLLAQRGGYENPKLFRTSARYWTKRRSGATTDAPPPPGDELPALEQWLASGLASSQVHHIHLRRRRALWANLAAALSQGMSPQPDIKAWEEALEQAAIGMEADALRVLRPVVERRALQVAASRDAVGRPRIFGPLGAMVNGLAGLRPASRRLLMAPEPAPSIALEGQPAPPSPAHSIASMAQRRLAALEWRAQECQLPSGPLQQQWHERTFRLEDEIAEQMDLAAGRAASRTWSRARRTLGTILLVTLELAASVLIGLAAYRVARGFLFEQYNNLPLLLNLLVLYGSLLFVYATMRAWMFPDTAARATREMTQEIESGWVEWLKHIKASGRAHGQQCLQVHKAGVEFQSATAKQADALGRELASAPDDVADTTRQLFAEGEQRTADK